MKHYMGFALRIEEKRSGIFFELKKQEEVFCKMKVRADSFAEAQEAICNELQAHKISVAFIFPYVEEDLE